MSKKILSILLAVVLAASFVSFAFADYNPFEERYQVIVVTDGGGSFIMDGDTYYPGSEVYIRAVPKDGFMFYGWKSDDVEFFPPDNDLTCFIMPARDIVIGAVFGKKATESTASTVPVTFDTTGGTAFPAVYVNVGSCVEMPQNVPVKAGYTFAGWYSDATCTLQYNFSTPVNAATIIYAKWAPENSTGAVDNAFSDVKSGDWFYNCVTELANRNIVSGMGNKMFMPSAEVTRAQFVTILANLAQVSLTSAETPFADVSASAWYAKAVAWAYNNGVVTGVSKTSFAPEANITRQDMAVMIKRFTENVLKTALRETVAQSAFADDASIASYAKDAVYAMQRSAIISGRPGNVFDPKANATRAESCKMIYSLLQLLA